MKKLKTLLHLRDADPFPAASLPLFLLCRMLLAVKVISNQMNLLHLRETIITIPLCHVCVMTHLHDKK